MATQGKRQRQQWKKQVELWQASDVSAAQWCRQHNLSYQAFLHWKGRFASARAKGLTIQLARDFDVPTLQRLLRVMRKG